MESLFRVVSLQGQYALLQHLGRFVDAVNEGRKTFDLSGLIAAAQLRCCSFLGVQNGSQITAVVHDGGQDLLTRHIHHRKCLDPHGTNIVLHGDFVAGVQFGFGVDPVLCQHLDVLRIQNHLQCIRCRAQVLQTAHFGSFPDPGVVISVAVEENPLVLSDRVADQLVQAAVEVAFTVLQYIGKAFQRFGNRAVDHDVGAGDGVVGAHHTKLELIACKGEGRGPVAVRGITVKTRQHICTQAQSVFLRSGIRAVCFNGFEHSGQLIPQKHGHDSRWRLVCPQSVVVSRRSDAHAQQALIIVDRLNDRHQEEQKLGIFIRRLART